MASFERRTVCITPGYTGHVPGFKTSLGERFGTTSSNYLAGQKDVKPIKQPSTPAGTTHIEEPGAFFPPQPQIIPGYTGHVPGLKSNTGERFGTTSHNFCSGSGTTEPNNLQYSRTYTTAVVEDDGELEPRSVPGYTGFVPGAKRCIGMSEGATQKQATNDLRLQFQNRSQRSIDILDVSSYPASIPLTMVPPKVHPPPDRVDVTARPYSKKFGAMKGYTGHVPQSKFLSTGRSFAYTAKLAAKQLQAGVPPKNWTARDEYDYANDRHHRTFVHASPSTNYELPEVGSRPGSSLSVASAGSRKY